MITTGATLFSGFGGVEIGMKAAGVRPVWGIECDHRMAAVARDNGHPVITADILEANPADFPAVDVLHASPPCPNFSQAKTGAGETEEDIALAAAVCWFIATLQPKVFTLENVLLYRKSVSFFWIVQVLRAGGYHVRWWHLNAANYGVPQTRKRLVLVAARDFVPRRPTATHQDPATMVAEQLPLFSSLSPLRPWVGWYETVEDLIPALPDSQFADWQIDRLPAWVIGLLKWGKGYKEDGEPYFSVTASLGDRPAHLPRAFLVDPNNPSRDSTIRACDEPMVTVTATHMRRPITTPRALMPGGRVVQMTPRALARFQSFPDWFQLPDNLALACKGIGNAVPPLLYQRVMEAQRG